MDDVKLTSEITVDFPSKESMESADVVSQAEKNKESKPSALEEVKNKVRYL